MLPDGFAQSFQVPSPDFASDSRFGESYEMIRELGRGGMAIVYLMRERATGKERAVKVIHSKFLDDEEAVARFDREARLLAQLDHPNIVATHSVQWIEGAGFGLIMDHVPGRTLKQMLREGTPIPFDQATRILDDIAAALSCAHEHGIVHRDVKPENIFIDDESGRALLADFGIARSVQNETLLTLAGVAIGTPTYMAPEQIDGSAIDARSDLYSLGLVGWEMLTGRRPWDGETLYNVIYHQKHDRLAAIDALRPDTPARLVYAVEGLLEKSPADRWQSAAEFRSELSSTEPPVHRERRDAAPDETIAIPIPAKVRVRSAFRRFAPVGAVVALAVSATLMFAWPAPSWMPINRKSPTPAAHPDGRSSRPGPAAVAHSPIASYGAPAAAAASLPAASAPPVGQATPVAGTGGAITYPAPAMVSTDPIAGSLASGGIAIAPTADSPSATAPITPTVAAPPRAVVPTPAARFTIATGGAHTCMIVPAGGTYCWGANNAGQLGTGATQTVAAPAAVAGSQSFVRIAPGLSHTCALNDRGSVFCWGNNDHGQLGDGSRSSRDVPARAVTTTPLESIASGASFTCGLGRDGDAYCWGAGASGQIGDGAARDRATPAAVSGSVAFTTLAAGWNHVCGLSTGGRAYCWGANDAGQLGDGTTSDRATPTPVHSDLRFSALSAGSAHTCGITTDGAVYCWGDNKYGQLGDGTQAAHLTPLAVSTDQHFVAVSAGSVHTCAVTQSHSAWCWGRNTYGQLGDGSAVSRTTPVQVSGGHDFTTVKAFGSHTCGSTTSGELFCWGYNLDGQLGDGTRDHRLRPTYIEKPGA